MLRAAVSALSAKINHRKISCKAKSIDVVDYSLSEEKIHCDATDGDFEAIYDINYKENKIADGGFATVYWAIHRQSREKVAVKKIEKRRYAPGDKSLQREMQVLTQISHPNCVHLEEGFITDTHVYLVFELVTGGELLDRVCAKERYSEKEAARVTRELLEGVAYLHSRKIVHRDLKLENILFQTPDEEAQVKIADFGLAKIVSENSVLTTVCGSAQYVAPEVLEVGRTQTSYTPAVDLWSIGVILYILLCGQTPFDDENDPALFRKIREGRYNLEGSIWDDISEDAKDVVQSLLCVDADLRLTAEEALTHAWIRGETPSTTYQEAAACKGAERDLQKSPPPLHILKQQEHVKHIPSNNLIRRNNHGDALDVQLTASSPSEDHSRCKVKQGAIG